ncbi:MULTISPECIES: hypothetical protein [unclassified Idiomarina]|jgi:hypothetical protein|uniref:hypothetical protein n=2 Tax=Idiomarina TaxID=135575 RepID=UPI00257E3FB7|nr:MULTISPECIES: hypothetical protein [unclassified Idiomarina]|tara:strand:+ start:12410 stop:13006 length:597 start_codon:yes stop_codon:yes gene_type:complete
MIRDDLSNRLIHLTKGSFADAEAVFNKIIQEKCLRGSNSSIRGGHNVICFSEAPLSKLGLILANPNAKDMRYMPFGFMFEKEYLFNLGARPAIYQPNSEFDLLYQEQQFRHVRFEPEKGIDWTWEREWRLQTDELPLDSTDVTLIVPDRDWVAQAHERHHDELVSASIALKELAPMFIGQFEWHFIGLSDLGFEIPKA